MAGSIRVVGTEVVISELRRIGAGAYGQVRNALLEEVSTIRDEVAALAFVDDFHRDVESAEKGQGSRWLRGVYSRGNPRLPTVKSSLGPLLVALSHGRDVIHVQTGTMEKALVVGISKDSPSTGEMGFNVGIMTDFAPYAMNVLFGTQRMISRPLTPFVQQSQAANRLVDVVRAAVSATIQGRAQTRVGRVRIPTRRGSRRR